MSALPTETVLSCKKLGSRGAVEAIGAIDAIDAIDANNGKRPKPAQQRTLQLTYSQGIVTTVAFLAY